MFKRVVFADGLALVREQERPGCCMHSPGTSKPSETAVRVRSGIC
jgi:hypothetical protein